MTPLMESMTPVWTGAVCPERRLVLHAIRTYLSGDPGCLLPALAEPLDWVAVERIADYRSVTPLIAYALRQYGGDSVPPALRERLQQRLILTAQRNLVSIAEWTRILHGFDEANISVISLKGPVLALLAYSNFALREFNDIDLLVHPNQIAKARDILVASGYEICSPLAGSSDAMLLRCRNSQLDLIHRKQRIRVDLHWGAWHVMFPFQMPTNAVFQSARQEQYEAITFLAPSPEHLLIYLCAHGTKHCWRSLRWVCDIACHLHASANLDWQSCFHSAEACRCELVLKHSLLLVHRVLGVDLPPFLWNYCNCAEAHKLAETAMSLLLRESPCSVEKRVKRRSFASITGSLMGAILLRFLRGPGGRRHASRKHEKSHSHPRTGDASGCSSFVTLLIHWYVAEL